MAGIEELYVLSPVDDILENIGLPKTKNLLDAVSPKTILGGKLGLTSPGEVAEGIVDDIRGTNLGGGLPSPDRLFRR